MTHRISLIVATKDRPADLRRLLESLSLQTSFPAEVVVVDASQPPAEHVIAAFPNLAIRYLRHWPPSAAAQRNAGIRACTPTATLVGFADDDTTFEPTAFANMLNFWKNAAPDILGAAFNIRNHPQRKRGFLKQSALAEQIGLYSPTPGRVSASGWQTIICELEKNQFVDWVPSTAVLFRRAIFDHDVFDEFYTGYSYLEDLDLGYTISRIGRLAVVADAGFHHFPSTEGRSSARQFGRCEVRNRLYFVRKHNLSLSRCYLGLAIRFALTIGAGVTHWNTSLLKRALGNIEELLGKGKASPPNAPVIAQQ